MGRMLQDHRLAFDAIHEARGPFYLAVVVHSLDGPNTLMAAALDLRADVVVSRGGFAPIATGQRATRWAPRSGFTDIRGL